MSSTKLHSPYHKNQKDEILLRFDNSLIFHYVGISFKTQGLYFIVFVTRYLDLYKVILHPGKLADSLILYNSIMKVLYIALTLYICNMMMRVSPYRTTYDKNGDTYKVVQWAILPAAILAILFHRHTSNLFLDVFFISVCKI